MSEGYHPEIDDSPVCNDEDSSRCRSIIGCCFWIIVLGQFDIAYATSAMSRFNMSPREGHLKAVRKILSYLKAFPKGRIIVDTSYQIIPFIQLKIIRIGRISILKLRKKFQMTYLLQRVQKSE